MAWNGSGKGGASAAPKKPVKAKPLALGKGAVAGVIVVVAAALAAYFLLPSEKPSVKEPTTEKPKKIEVVKPAEVVKTVDPESEKPKVEPEKAARAAKFRAMTPAERLEFLFEEAKKKPIDFTTTTNRSFATGTEQVMSWVFTTRVGDMPPPMPKMSIRDEAHLAEILLADNPVLEGDSEKAKEAKEMVELAKKEAIEFVKQGGEVQEFLDYYRGQLVQAHMEWQESQRAVIKIIHEDPDLAVDFVESLNKKLGEKGIKPVVIPQKFRQELGLE